MKSWVLLALLLIPVAQAQVTVATAELTIEGAVDVSLVDCPDCSEGASVGNFATGRPGFYFQEPANEAGYGAVSVAVDVPAGADIMEITFGRELQIDSGAVPDPSTAQTAEFLAELGLAGSLSEPSVIPISDKYERSPFQFAVDGPGRVFLVWEFAETSPPATPDAVQDILATPAPVYSMVARIIEPTATFRDIPVLADNPVADGDVARDTIEKVMRARAVVPEESGAKELVFRVDNEWLPVRVILPSGQQLDIAGYTTHQEAGGLYLTISALVLDTYGPGDYTAVFTTTVPLQPSPIMAPFIVMLALAPVIAGVFATRGSVHFSARAVGKYEDTGRLVRGALYALWAVYALVGAIVLVGRLVPLIISWPIPVEAAFVHSTWAAITVLFILIELLWRRQTERAMQEQLLDKERLNSDLKRSNDELEQFAYIASHDLQEPLRTVNRFTQLLQRRYGDQLDDDAKEFMEYSVDGAQRMQQLIDDLLMYSRVGSRGTVLTAVDLDVSARRVVNSLQGAIDGAGAVINVQPLPTVLGESSQLEQVLQNLVGNAIKFCKPGHAPKIHVRAVKQEKLWRIEVQDNGIGIPEMHRQRIFTVFQRLHDRETYAGTGIGLAVCKKIVERHGGTIGVEANNDGSTFWFTLVGM